MIWDYNNMKAVAVIKSYLNKIKRNEEKNTLIATEIVEELDRNGLFFMERE